MKKFIFILFLLFLFAGYHLIKEGHLVSEHTLFPGICTFFLYFNLLELIRQEERHPVQVSGRILIAMGLISSACLTLLLLERIGVLLAVVIFILLSGPVLFRQKTAHAAASFVCFLAFSIGLYHYAMGLPLPADLWP